MTVSIAVVNLVLGLAYTGYGVMTALELRRDWRTFGFSLFGAAWITMAFTCGPHHLAHGIHLLAEGRAGGFLDLVTVVVGLPVGLVWLALRIEAFAGGRGDRFIPGTPRWLSATPALATGYLALVAVAGAGVLVTSRATITAAAAVPVAANVLLVGVYMAIGWFVIRTQLANRSALGGWSVSGLCLGGIFPTCAVMHAVWGLYAVAGQYHHDVHSIVIDWASVPAGLFFLAVVRGLYRDSISDWNEGPEEVTAPAGGFVGAGRLSA